MHGVDSVTFRLKSYCSLSILPNSLPQKQNQKHKKQKQNPTFCPNHTFSRGGGLSWWLNQGWGRGDCGSGSRRLQSAARFKSKGGERVRSNKHQQKCIIPPKMENHSWLYSTNNSKGNTQDSILLSFLSCLLLYVVILLLNEWRQRCDPTWIKFRTDCLLLN